ncbi:MAG: alpha/beta hydrolase [Sphingobium sp.]
MTEYSGPTSHSFLSQRTRLHYLDWGNTDAPPLLLIHGGRDHARTWDWTARALRHDYHVIAPDLRGHGDSDWSSDGGYNIASWVFDLAQLIDHLNLGPVTIVAHSLGGAISLRYTGLFPEKVRRLVSVEGSGALPPDIVALFALPQVERMERFIADRRRLAKPAYRYATMEDAIARMRASNADLSDEQVLHLATHAVRRNEDGSFSWKYDPYVRSQTPLVGSDTELAELWGRIACPVLLAWGRRSWGADPGADGTVGLFPNARTEAFDGGHWLHHDCFDAFMARLTRFLATDD